MRRRFLPILLFVSILPLAMAGGVCGAESPIQITSDRLDAYDDKAPCCSPVVSWPHRMMR